MINSLMRQLLFELCFPYESVVGIQIPSSHMVNWKSLYELSMAERVLYRLDQKYSELTGACREYQRNGVSIETTRLSLHGLSDQLESVAAGLPFPILMAKGPTLERLYPQGYRRQYFDLDLLVQNNHHACLLFDALRGLGFTELVKEPLIYCLPFVQEESLSVKFVRPSDGAKVEVTGGALPNSTLSGLPIGELIKYGVNRPSGSGLLQPDLPTLTTLYVSELSERPRGRLIMRDFFDWVVLDRHLQTRDIPRIVKLLDQYGLWAEFDLVHSLPYSSIAADSIARHRPRRALMRHKSMQLAIHGARKVGVARAALTLAISRLEKSLWSVEDLGPVGELVMNTLSSRVDVRARRAIGGPLFMAYCSATSAPSIEFFKQKGSFGARMPLGTFALSAYPIFREDQLEALNQP